MYRIGKRFTFEASHVLSGLPKEHKCARLHGHGYAVEVEVAADALTDLGWVTDFGDLAPFGRYLDEQFDHRHLNDVIEGQPTSENLAAHFFGWCAGHLDPVIPGRVTAVRVSEKREATWAEYRPDSR